MPRMSRMVMARAVWSNATRAQRTARSSGGASLGVVGRLTVAVLNGPPLQSGQGNRRPERRAELGVSLSSLTSSAAAIPRAAETCRRHLLQTPGRPDLSLGMIDANRAAVKRRFAFLPPAARPILWSILVPSLHSARNLAHK